MRPTIACGPFFAGAAASSAQPLLFDFLELLAHDTKPRHVATKLRTRILRQKRSFGGPQFAELFIGLA
jgi:hypothetical protein